MIIRDAIPAFEFTAEVVVIGAGACGMTAALAARQAGAEVVVLEQDPVPRGSTAMSYGGVCAAGTAEQAAGEVSDTPDAFLADILAMTEGKTSQALAATIAAEAGPTLDWLRQDHEVMLELEPNWVGLGHSRPRMHFPKSRSGEELVGMLTRALESSGAHLLTRSKVVALYADDAGRVLGVRAERPGGFEDIGCDKLILATCGFGANPEMVRRHIPELAEARYFGHEGNRGDAIVWGEALGAAVADMGSYQALGSLSDPECAVVPPTLMMDGGVLVNRQGHRIHNELVDVSGQALRVLAQPGGVCWMIYDERLHQAARAAFADYRAGDVLNAFRSAATVEGLAAVTGVEPQGLAATLAQAAQLKRDGGVDSFGRDFTGNPPLVAPYYAVRVTGALFHTQGGLCVDGEGRVLDASGAPLANLYAGGGAARSVSGPGGWGYLPGMGICAALTLGRLAGRHAAGALSHASEEIR